LITLSLLKFIRESNSGIDSWLLNKYEKTCANKACDEKGNSSKRKPHGFGFIWGEVARRGVVKIVIIDYFITFEHSIYDPSHHHLDRCHMEQIEGIG